MIHIVKYIMNNDYDGMYTDQVFPENQPLVNSYNSATVKQSSSVCSFSLVMYTLIPLCIISDLLAIWYKSTILYIIAVCISICLCAKSACFSSVLILLQCFVGIYYHVFVMTGIHMNLNIAGIKI